MPGQVGAIDQKNPIFERSIHTAPRKTQSQLEALSKIVNNQYKLLFKKTQSREQLDEFLAGAVDAKKTPNCEQYHEPQQSAQNAVA